jgi:hypothetical protein
MREIKRYKCIKLTDGFDVGKIYTTDIFNWMMNGKGLSVFKPENFELVKDEPQG